MKIVITIFIALILVSCSGSEKATDTKPKFSPKLEQLEEQEVRLEIIALNSWVNLMPGAESRFHLSGELIVEKNYKYDFKFMILKSISVVQNEKEIFVLNPTVQVDEQNSSNEKKYLRFSTLRGVDYSMMLEVEKSINLKLIFDDGNKQYIYNLENMTIEKTY